MKSFIIFALLCLGAQQIGAQTVIQGSGPSAAGGELMFGTKAGLNVSTFLGRDYVDITPKPGVYFGGIAEIPVFMDNFYLQPELLVSFQGADVGPENLNLLYVHVPLMAKYHITDGIAAEFGPQIGVKLSDNGDKVPGDPETKSLHLGLNFGGGYRLNENFYFQLRFGLGLSRVLDIDNTNTRNGILSIGACYFF